MSSYVILKDSQGQLYKFLADDDGIIQQSSNGDPETFTDLIVPAPTGTVESVTGETTDAVNNTDPANPIIADATPLNAGTLAANDKAQLPRLGADLADDTVSVAPGTDKCSVYVLPSGTLTQNRTIGLAATGVANGDQLFIVVRDISANSYTINNDLGAEIAKKNASPGQAMMFAFYFTGGHWIFNFRMWAD